MKINRRRFKILLLIVMMITACQPTAPAPSASPVVDLSIVVTPISAPSSLPTSVLIVPLQVSASTCPVATTYGTLYINQEGGYCLLVPFGFETRRENNTSLRISSPPLDQSLDPVQAVLYIVKESAVNGRNLQTSADEYFSANINDPSNSNLMPLTIGGEQAFVKHGFTTGERQLFVRSALVVHNDAIYYLTLYPVGPDFPQATQDVERLWDTALTSFTWLSNPPPMTDDLDQDKLTAFTRLITGALLSRNYDLLPTYMGETFNISSWRAEGSEMTPAEAVERLRTYFLASQTQLNFLMLPSDMLTQELGGVDPRTLYRSDANVVSALNSMGWGPEGTGEALILIAQAPDGHLYFNGVLVALNGFK